MISEWAAMEIALGIVVTLLMTLLGVLLHHISTCSAVHDRVARLEEWRDLLDGVLEEERTERREERREQERYKGPERRRASRSQGDVDPE
jgi:anti-sigma factor RsiW